MSAFDARRERTILDRCVLATMTWALVLAVLPWLWGLCPLQISGHAWTLAVYGAVYWTGAALLDRVERPVTLRAGGLGLQILTVLTLTWSWHLAGGVSNLAFLSSFAPVLLAQALLLTGWLPLGLAAVSSIGVVSVALAESDGLRLLAYRYGLPPGILGESLRLRQEALPPSDAPSQDLTALLLFVGFAFVLVAIG